jgi:UDP-N-acetylmuramate: L-alanyl-gamma-D-glutamyl-meso-diaminopimelate ligase
VRWALAGLYNARNAAMAATAVGLTLNPVDPTRLDLSALARFRGVQRRQQVLVETPAIAVVEDFGHHPTAIRETLRSLRVRHPGRRIIAAFEPRSNTARTRILQAAFTEALSLADAIVLGPVSRGDRLGAEERFDTDLAAAGLRTAGRKAVAAASSAAAFAELERLAGGAGGPSLVVFFSNGSFDGIIGRFAEAVKIRA